MSYRYTDIGYSGSTCIESDDSTGCEMADMGHCNGPVEFYDDPHCRYGYYLCERHRQYEIEKFAEGSEIMMEDFDSTL